MLLNNDVEVISREWLYEMVSHAIRPEIGAVGAKLYYENDTVQHAGVILGIGPDRVAGHSHRGAMRQEYGYAGRLSLLQNLSAVTAACLAVAREKYLRVGGLDAANLGVAFNDVDFCLRLQALGLRNVYTPYAELYHYESLTRGYEDTPEKRQRFLREAGYMKQCWSAQLQQDRYFNPNLDLDYEAFILAPTPRVKFI